MRAAMEMRVSISSIMNTGLSALTANQQAMKVTSTNVANVNTEGYSRLEVQFQSRKSSGGVVGVEINVTRVASAYLAAAEMRGAADVASTGALANFMDRAQGLLGDPSNKGTVFATLDPVFSGFGALAVDPSSALRRSSTLSDLQTMLNQVATTAREISALRDEAHARVTTSMSEANSLMSGIARLNEAIQRATIGGVSASEAETEQARMLDRLAEIIDIRVQQRTLGGVEVRTTDGMLLVDLAPATIALNPNDEVLAYPGLILIPPRGSAGAPLNTHLGGGELKGLMQARDRELVNLELAFGEFAAGAAEALNAAHNKSTPVPPPATMTGRNTGLIGTDLLNFSGATNIGIVDRDGEVVRNLRIDFNAGTITDEGGVVTNFANTINAFETALGSALGASGTVDFSGGSLSLTSLVANTGIVITDDPGAPATRAGRGFSHTFGLNDLVTKSQPLNYATGLSAADDHGFTAGQTITFAVRNNDGAVTRTIEYTVGAGSSLSSIRTDINSALNGYAQATLDANGRLTITPTGNGVGRIDVIDDTTRRGDTDLSLSQLFGLGEALPAGRAIGLSIRSDIAGNPGLLGTAQADLAGALAGTRVLLSGDGRGALGLEAAGVQQRTFAAAGGLSGQVTSVLDYAARLAGHAGVRAEALDGAHAAAKSVREEVAQRRMGEEGVNLDEELVKMTTYQQAYSAASRMITAARDLYDVLLNMV